MTRSLVLIMAAVVSLAVGTGCASDSKARAQADFRVRQQALRQEEARKHGVAFNGPVVNTLVPWTEGLTFGQAIGAAGWHGNGDPRLIILTRGEEIVAMTPDQALAAANEPAQPGDIVDMLP